MFGLQVPAPVKLPTDSISASGGSDIKRDEMPRRLLVLHDFVHAVS